MILAAHPEGIFRFPGNFLWKALVSVGMDISMTPLTADMTLMLGPDQNFIYQRNMNFEIFDGEKWIRVPWDQLGFYEVRIPLLLMLELIEGGVSIRGHAHAICYQMKNKGFQIKSFRVSIVPRLPQDQNLGFGSEWGCE